MLWQSLCPLAPIPPASRHEDCWLPTLRSSLWITYGPSCLIYVLLWIKCYMMRMGWVGLRAVVSEEMSFIRLKTGSILTNVELRVPKTRRVWIYGVKKRCEMINTFLKNLYKCLLPVLLNLWLGPLRPAFEFIFMLLLWARNSLRYFLLWFY